MAHPDPDRRKQIASLAAHTSWARTPHRAERMAPANRGRERALADRVDPDRTMTPAERAKAIESQRAADQKRLSMAGVEARRAKARAKRAA